MTNIRRLFRRVLIPALLLGAMLPAHAGLIVLSGDTNITNGLDGSFGVPVTAGNQQFFTNVLGAGSSVLVQDNCTVCAGSIGTAVSAVNDHYNSLGGVSSSTHAGAITAAALSGVDLFVSILPESAFSASELAALSSFGGSIMFLGENSFATAQNNNINAALAALGSSMSLLNTIFDAGILTATGAQIAADPLTAGVSSFVYGAPTELLVSGGTGLLFGMGGEAFIAYEGGAAAVPEPGMLSLLGAGLIGFGLTRRRRRAR